MAVPLMLALAPGLLQAGLGGYEAIKSGRQLKKLGKTPYPYPTVSPELQTAYQRAMGMSQTGYTPQERASFENRLAQQQMAGQRQAVQVGGGQLAGAIGAGMRAQQLGAQSMFAAEDARLRRQSMRYADTLAQAMQHQKNIVSEAQMRRRTMEEQALGGGMKAGLENIVNALGGAASIMSEAGVGGKTNRTTTGDSTKTVKAATANPNMPPMQSAGKPFMPISAADLTEYAPGYDRSEPTSFSGNVFSPGNPVGVYGRPDRRQYALSDYITNPYGGGTQ